MKKRFIPKKGYGGNKKVEQGAITKRGKGLIRAALVYPNTYKAGMSSLGFQAVYKIANQIEDVACERVFLPDKKAGQTPIKSLESGIELNQFDVILFSISFENDFFHLVQLLGEAGIPLRSPDRNHIHPLVVAGGVACFLNPAPIAPFVDCFLLGEAECLLPDFFERFKNKTSQKNFLETLEEDLPGAFCPTARRDQKSFKINVAYLKTLETITTSSAILTRDTAFKDIFLIETLKGCPHGCRFCSAGFIYRPPRIYPKKNILSAIDDAKKLTNKIGLVSSAVADHPDIEAICDYAAQKKMQVSFSSLRADKLEGDLLSALKLSKIKTATIAPEAGSQRMRNVINKKLTETQIFEAVRKIVQIGIINIRLYFMIGLPFEETGDVKAIVDLTRQIKSVFLEESKKKKKIGTLTLSVNPFIPKPSTPFQWAAMDEETVLKQKALILRDGLKKTANVKLNFESFRQAKIHALLSLGDDKMADVIETAITSGWPAAVRKNQEYCHALIYKTKSLDAPLPWDFINNGIKKSFLAKEFEKAGQAKTSAPCPMIDCTRCRVCMID